MVTIKEVRTKHEQKEFVEYPLRLYRGNPNFVPPLYGDEMKMFRPDFVYRDTCEYICFLAEEDGKTVGRISGILQKASNEKRNEKRVRFTRFDCIDRQDVADALFRAVENWAVGKGMDTVCGPLNFSDLEREGLLIEGFDELSTFEEQYNAPYYQALIENLGYRKEVDWLEFELRAPAEADPKIHEMSDYVLNRYHLHIGESKNTNDFLKKYSGQFFKLLDIGYEDIYGTVPFTDGMKKMMMDNFRLIIDTEHVIVILDEKEEIVCLGICFPSIARAVQKSGGKLTPAALARLLKAIKKPRAIDLGLIAVKPEYLNRGITAVITSKLLLMLSDGITKTAETNLNLEDNFAILNCWKRFDARQHKKRRSYVKKLDGGKADTES